jgi:tetratricopeptide (TPR) repeat protein
MTSAPHAPFADTDASASSFRQRALASALAIVLLIAVAMVAYCNCYNTSFHFDDSNSIVDNMSIRQWSTMFSPPNANGETVSGRPLLNATFRINYAISKLDVWSYHVVNVLIHTLAGLALLGVVRRTLLLPCMRRWFDAGSALRVAWLVAAIWVAHPINTESVTYIVQRAESFMALWYLLALYCFIRSVENCAIEADDDKKPARNWMIASWLACLAGMASKEVMISAPVLMFLYDRTFVGGSFREAWRKRKSCYGAFALTWILLAVLMLRTGQRGNTVGFTGEMTWWAYGFTQCWALARYLGQAFWPGTLVFDYGIEVITDFPKVWMQAVMVALLVAGTILAFFKYAPKAGWAGLFFLTILAPTTTIIPVVTQVAAEHRMYLPLTALVAVVVICLYAKFGRKIFWAGVPVVAVLMILTVQRNRDYQDALTLWKDVIQKHPRSSRAHSNYGYELISWSRLDEGLESCLKAIELNPRNGDAVNNVGFAYAMLEKYQLAIDHYRKALAIGTTSGDIIYNNVCYALYKMGEYDRAWKAGMAALEINSHCTPALVNLGNILVAQKRYDEAAGYYNKALEIHPRQADALNNLGNVVALQKRLGEALDYYKKAVEYAPRIVEAQDNVARLLVLLGRPGEALPYFERELALKPGMAEAHTGMGGALVKLDRVDEAAEHYGEAVRLDKSMAQSVCDITGGYVKLKRYRDAEKIYENVLKGTPDCNVVRYNYGNMLALEGRYEESIVQYREVVRNDPDHSASRQNLGTILVQQDRPQEALEHFEAAVRLDPGLAPVRHNYAVALGECGRVQDAIEQEEAALRMQPRMRAYEEHLRELRDKLQLIGK